ncbi:MAG: hypothetical protein RMJ66_04515 [Bacteroidia bacterium]|nr:hypothetical protein [Bacteroidia bacterium]
MRAAVIAISLLMKFTLGLGQGVYTSVGLRQGQAYFRENKGQVRDQEWKPRWDILFSGEAGGVVYHLRSDGFILQLMRLQRDNVVSSPSSYSPLRGGDWEIRREKPIILYRVEVSFVGCQSSKVFPEKELNEL